MHIALQQLRQQPVRRQVHFMLVKTEYQQQPPLIARTPFRWLRTRLRPNSVLVPVLVPKRCLAVNMFHSIIVLHAARTGDGRSSSSGLRLGSVVRTSVFGWRTFPDLCLIYGWLRCSVRYGSTNLSNLDCHLLGVGIWVVINVINGLRGWRRLTGRLGLRMAVLVTGRSQWVQA